VPKLADRVQVTSTTTGTGTFALGSATTGFRTFNAAFTNGDIVYYAAEDSSGNWEVGYGAVGTATLTRTVIESSNANALVPFPGPTTTVFCTAPAQSLPADQTSNSGKYLTTDGTTTSWATTTGSLASPTITGTVAGGATYTSPTLTGASITAANSNTVEATSGPTSTQLAGNRNKVINGAMQVSQRGTSIAAISTDFTYTADRWAITRGGTINYTQGTSSPPTGFQCYAQYINQSAGNPFLSAIQVIESVNTYDLIGQTVTLSAWIKAAANTSGSTAASLNCGYATTADARLTAFVGAGQSLTLSSSSWARYTYTFTVPSNALTLSPTISLGTMAVGDGLLITGVQLEKGATATPFENRLYGAELALCQRYYASIYIGFDAVGNIYAAQGVTYPVPMRASPTYSAITYTLVSGNVSSVGFDIGSFPAGRPLTGTTVQWGLSSILRAYAFGDFSVTAEL